MNSNFDRLPPARVRIRHLPPARVRVRQPQQFPVPPSNLPPVRQRTKVDAGAAAMPTTRVERSPEAILKQFASKTLDPRTITPSEERHLRRHCRRFVAEGLVEVERLRLLGHVRDARRAARFLNGKLATRLHAMFRAKRKPTLRAAQTSSEEIEAFRIRRLVDVFVHLERLTVTSIPARGWLHYKRKPNGGLRPITRFFWLDRARQHLIAFYLQPFADFHNSQFHLARDPDRRGPAAVREDLKRALEEVSETHLFLHLDVKNFYSEISHQWLEEHTPLPRDVMRAHVHTGGMIINGAGDGIVRDIHEAKTRSDRRGIPQGSALSPLVAEMVMADVLRSVAVAEDVKLFVWSDNIGALVPRHKVSEFEELIRAAFALHGAGPFQITTSISDPCREVRFLGVWYKCQEGKTELFVPELIFEAWRNKTLDGWTCASVGEIEAMQRRVKSKMASWRWWSRSTEIEGETLAMLEDYKSTFALLPEGSQSGR